jgi:hypothetical protein
MPIPSPLVDGTPGRAGTSGLVVAGLTVFFVSAMVAGTGLAALAGRVSDVERSVRQLHAEHDEAPACEPVIFADPLRVEMR